MLDNIDFLKEKFKEIYQIEPTFYVRAPGRVNLIGEHIDYCGYAVFPMAIRQCISIAVAHRDDGLIKIANTNPECEDFQCPANDFQINEISPRWYKYVMCGIQGILEESDARCTISGLSLLVDGDIPPSAGLSSSSALVCASALMTSRVVKTDLSPKHLADICARCERYIGTQGGGMDQAASFMSNAGAAQLIEFDPLKCTDVSLPQGANFVVLNSLVIKNKATTSEFNTRVVECRLACRILAKKCNITLNSNATLKYVQDKMARSFSEMIEIVKEYLHPQPYSKPEICQLLNLSDIELEKNVLSSNTRHVTEFHLYKRALHVFTEASRVWEFKEVCDTWNERAEDLRSEHERFKVLSQLGKLMKLSHASTQHLYECSHPHLDELVELSKEVTLGARLTGAGWGGCIVALVLQEKTEEYIEKMKKQFYLAHDMQVTNWDSVIFSTKPEDGASIFVP